MSIAMQVPDNYFSSRQVASALSTDSIALPLDKTCSLFESSHGMKLPVEVSLQIIEDVIDLDPKISRVLMSLSKVGLDF